MLQPPFMKKMLPALVAVTVLLAGCDGDDGSDGAPGPQGEQGAQGPQGPQGPAGDDGDNLTQAPALVRLATTPLGAEVTGMYKTDNGEMFFNVQHPSDTLPEPENNAAVGALVGVDVDNLDPRTPSVAVPASGSAEALTTQVAEGEYEVLGRAGDTFGGDMPFGLGAIVNAAGDSALKISQNPDFNAYVPSRADGREGYLFSAWEDRPGAVSRMRLQRLNDGTWAVRNVMNVDFSPVKGTMINCFGTLSPWGTPLTSEENYEAENVAMWNNPDYPQGYPSSTDVSLIQDYLGGQFPNPYDYGYIVEITAPTSLNPVPVKLFTLGRMAHENPVIMPDRKTVYLTDDGSNKAFFKFVADTAGDLSSGTLYAAKVEQDATRDVSKAGFDITWIELGHSTNAQIEAWIDEYDGIDRSDYVDGGNSYITDAEIQDWAANGAGDDRYAFIESLKAAAAKGATVEFNKMEGININFNMAAAGTVPFMYVAMSDVTGAMADQEGDIQVDAQRCGVVYRFNLDSEWNTSRMDPAVVGGPYNSNAATNRCDVDNISNPDNLFVLNDGRVVIGEDSGNHENNMVWVFNPQGQ